MIKVSIIIPVYNSEKFLERCLSSVCNQTLDNLEIICINDCSTDNSLEILRKYPVKVINLQENKGAAYARNLGIKEAKGEYIGFVDSDDFVDLDFYEKLYTRALNMDADAAKGNIKIYDNITQRSETESWLDLNNLIKKNKAYFYFTFTTAIYKREFILKNHINFLEGLIHFEDPYFTIKACLFYERLCIVDNVFYYYTNNPESSTRKQITIKHPENQVYGSKLILKLLDESDIDKKHYVIVINFVINQLLDWCRRYDVSDEINTIAAKGLNYILDNCKYREEVLIEHFLFQKQETKKNIFRQLRKKIQTGVNK